MNKREKILNLLLNEPYKLGKHIGFNDLTELHNEWIKNFIYGDRIYTLEAHRNSYKTSCVEVALAIIALIMPDVTVGFYRKTDTDTKEVKKTVENILTTPLFNEFSKLLYNVNLSLVENSTTSITTNLCQNVSGTSQLSFWGINANKTGKHYDRIFTDDICGTRDRLSKAERETTIYHYLEIQNNILKPNGRIVNTCTPWHKEDVIEKCMKNKHFYDCYSTGILSPEKIEEKKSELTPSLFAANYELKHIVDENALFKDAKFVNDDNLLLDCIGHVDAGYGGEDATAFTLVKLLSDGRIIALGRKFQKHVDYCLPEIKSICEKYRCGSMWCEDNGDKGYLAEKMRKDYGLRAKTYHENTNKYDKICTHLHNAWKNVYFVNTDDDYINEILDYNEYSTHDDCVDSLACCIRVLNKRPSVEFI